MKKLVRVIQDKKYKAENGKEYYYESYYLETENGHRIAIMANNAYDSNARHDLKLCADETIDQRKPQ